VTALGKLFRTTAFKLSVVYLVLFSLGAGVVVANVGARLHAVLHDQISETVDGEIRSLLEQYAEGGMRLLIEAVDRRVRAPGGSLYLVTTPSGDSLAGNIAALPAMETDGRGLVEALYQRRGDSDIRRHHALARQFILPSGFRLVVGHDVEDHRALRVILQRALGASLFWLVLVGTLGGLFVAWRVLERVDEMSAIARRIMAGDMNERLAVSGAQDELDRLADNINAMLERIGELMKGLEEVSDNIAHDLRTPLTRLRNRAEDSLRNASGAEQCREALTRVIEESDGLIRVFDALLMIARAEAGHSSDAVAEIDAAAILSDIGEMYEPVAEEQGASLVTRTEDGLKVAGVRELLAQALVNLVDNALKYGGSGKSVELTAARRGERVELTVADRGPGISTEDRERVTGRFVRLENSRSRPGSGLGLSLVAAVARLHHGELRIEDNEPGLRVVISLPGIPVRAGAPSRERATA